MAKTLRLARELQVDSIVDGPGLRMVLWMQGCMHDCPGCHNPSTHSLKDGIQVEVNDILSQMRQYRYQNGLTLSGGEPFLQSTILIDIVKAVRTPTFTIWAYTGFKFEQLLKNENHKQLLEHVDVLVDGLFNIKQQDYKLLYKGSKNQRIIDVQKSIKKGEVVLSSYDYHNIE